jgi:hypothetical protein
MTESVAPRPAASTTAKRRRVRLRAISFPS